MAAKKKGVAGVWVGFANDGLGDVRYCRLGNGELYWRIGEEEGPLNGLNKWRESGLSGADLQEIVDGKQAERIAEINGWVREALAERHAEHGLGGDTWTHPKTGTVYDVADAGPKPWEPGKMPCDLCALAAEGGPSAACDDVGCVTMKYAERTYLKARPAAPLVREVVEPDTTLPPAYEALEVRGGGRLELIAVGEIARSPWQVREVEGTAELDAGIEELAASIRANGLANPLTVRARSGGGWELIAGHRRLAGCRRAGLALAPCYVIEADDRKAMDMLLVENLQRKDLTAIEEAHSVARMLAGGRTREEIAAASGKSVRWVYRRASICDIMTDWQALAVKMRLSAAFLERVGRLPASLQERLSKSMGVQNVLRAQDADEYAWQRARFERGGDVGNLDATVERLTRRLEGAPWWEKHAEWCDCCPRRTDAQPDLFDADEENEDGEKGPRCLGGECWEKMLTKCVEAARAELGKKYGKVEEIKGDSYWRYSDKRDKQHSVPVLVVDGDRRGEVRWGSAPEAGDGVAERPRGPTPKQKQEALYIRAVALVIEGAETAEWTDEEEGESAAADLLKLAALAVAQGLSTHSWAPKGIDPYCGHKRIKETWARMSNNKTACEAALWTALKPSLLNAMKFETVSCCEQQYKAACALAAVLEIPKGLIDRAQDSLAEKKGKKRGVK